MKLSFQINNYDRDGDIVEECILLHVGDATILKFSHLDELTEFAMKIADALKEIKDNSQ